MNIPVTFPVESERRHYFSHSTSLGHELKGLIKSGSLMNRSALSNSLVFTRLAIPLFPQLLCSEQDWKPELAEQMISTRSCGRALFGSDICPYINTYLSDMVTTNSISS